MAGRLVGLLTLLGSIVLIWLAWSHFTLVLIGAAVGGVTVAIGYLLLHRGDRDDPYA